jgi:hypothetical protein
MSTIRIYPKKRKRHSGKPDGSFLGPWRKDQNIKFESQQTKRSNKKTRRL